MPEWQKPIAQHLTGFSGKTQKNFVEFREKNSPQGRLFKFFHLVFYNKKQFIWSLGTNEIFKTIPVG